MVGHNLACSLTRIGLSSGKEEEDFSHEPATISLAGEHYFFSGRFRSYGRVHPEISKALHLDFDHTHGSNSTEYIILGPNLRFFRCSRIRQGDVAARNSSDFEDYEEITDFFEDRDVERPPFLYLGPDKSFYTRADDGDEKWKLSPEIIRNGLQITPGATRSAVQGLWLGVGDAWVAQYRDSRFRFDLKGQYANLKEVLKKKQEEEVSINALALNVTDGNSYACVFNDGTVKYQTGSARFNGEEFERWCEQNVNFTQRLEFS